MIPPIPVLADYGISPDHGFLPPEPPLDIIPDPYYAKWEAIVSNLQALVLSKRLRQTIDNLPVLSTSYLHSDAEWRRAYVVLVFMLHGYVWGGDKPAEVGFCCWIRKSYSTDDALDNSSTDYNSALGSLRLSGTASSRHLCCRLSMELQAHLPR